MKKTITILTCIASIAIFTWCATKYTTEINFDQFSFNVATTEIKLQEITEEQKSLFAKEENIYKVYTMTNKSWFSDSIVVYKEPLATQIPLERLMQINIKKTENRLNGFGSSSSSQIDTKCENDTIMTWYLASFKFDSITPKEKVYINQYFFTNSGYMYIISSSTESSTNNDAFKKWLKNIQCKTKK